MDKITENKFSLSVYFLVSKVKLTHSCCLMN